MRLPTKNEVTTMINIIRKEKKQPTESGLKRILAKYFHCKVSDIELILK